MEEIAALARELEEGKEALLAALEGCTPEEFAWGGAGRPLRALLEEAVDALNFRFGRLLAAALGLPPPPCVASAQLSSPREAALVLRVAHRRLLNLLHPLGPEDMERVAVTPEGEALTVAQILGQVAHAYREWAAEVRARREAYARLRGGGG